MVKQVLHVSEIFTSIQGIGRYQGRVCTFIRLAGCNFQCSNCEREYARNSKGEAIHLDDLMVLIDGMQKNKYVCITGGEPLLQKTILTKLVGKLIYAGYIVQINTNGSIEPKGFNRKAVFSLDFKLPSSGMYPKSKFWDINGWYVFTIYDEDDYKVAKRTISGKEWQDRDIYFVAGWKGMSARDLAGRILEDKLPISFGLQMHKILWGQDVGIQ